MRIVCIADTHGKHRTLDLPNGDVLVHAGDLSSFGDGYEDGLVWLKNRSFKHRFLVLGNHERGGFQYEVDRRIKQAQQFGIHVLDDDSVTIEGVTFGTELDQGDLDVLVTHQPPKGTLDSGKKEVWPTVDLTTKVPGTKTESLGSPAVRQAVQRSGADVHIFGHVHRAYGRIEKGGTTYLNCALAGEDYKPVNDPVVIDL
jgi:predicted phosphodiesterase